jgi:tetrahydromethanopterin S-methyltransferase subunit H
MPDDQITEEVSLDDSIIALLENGVEPTVIARAWGLDVTWINSLPAKRVMRVADEAEISESILQLMTMAVEEGRKILIEGTPTVKMRFIYSLLSTYIRNFASQTPKEVEDMRAEIMSILGGQTQIKPTVVEEDNEPIPNDDPSLHSL